MKLSIQSSIRRSLCKLLSGSYTSDDVKLLYVDLRDYSEARSITREIGDYIAHPKEKDRGLSHARVTAQIAAFRKMADLVSGRLPGQTAGIEVKPAFNSSDIVENLIRQLRQCAGLSDEEQLILRAQLVGVATSVICLLQDAVVKVGDERLSACADFAESKLSLIIQYPVDFRGSQIIILAELIEGALPPSSIVTIQGRPFWVEVSHGATTVKL
jgi:hypothetical protein